MRRLPLLGFSLLFALAPGKASAARPVDADGDAYASNRDCDDADPTVHPGAPEICGDARDNDCNGTVDDPDLCDGSEPPPPPTDPTGPHAGLTWQGPETCVACHREEAAEAHGSVHYQWQGPTPELADGPAAQGKNAGGLNSYCVSIVGNWNACGSCHVGRGTPPVVTNDPTDAQLAEVDCLTCHQEGYRRTKVDGVFVPDTGAMAITMDEAVRTVHRPTRATCVQCHAKGGGGDNYKRGDLALAHANTADRSFDVHMATTGADLACQDCHTTSAHRIAGRGSDLRPTDLDVTMSCTNCHPGKDTPSGHADPAIGAHVARVACQSCHVPRYARDAVDTAASEATEVHRTWLASHATATGALHPKSTLAGDLVPEYRFWNGTSDNYLLGEVAVLDPVTGAYPTSRPLGDIGDPASKLYPFKYKTAEQPLAVVDGQLIAIDTSVFFATGDADAATRAGLANMGLPPQDHAFVPTDTFQLITHEVAPAADALGCQDCHGAAATQVNLAALGYELKADRTQVCTQCHKEKKRVPDWQAVHDGHVDRRGYDCSWCHPFSRPERGLTASR